MLGFGEQVTIYVLPPEESLRQINEDAGIWRIVAPASRSARNPTEGNIAMDKPRKTAKQLLDMKKQAGFFSVSANSTVKAALEVLSEKNIGAVLVMEGTKLVGIFSERDYARKGKLQGRTAGSTALREVMTSNIVSVTPDRMVEECRRIMGERRIRHLPVLDGEKVIGVLSSKDILDEIIAEDEKLIRDLETERLQMTTTAGNY